MRNNGKQYWAQREGEEEARHVMGAVPIVLLMDVIFVAVVICLGASILVALFR